MVLRSCPRIFLGPLLRRIDKNELSAMHASRARSINNGIHLWKIRFSSSISLPRLPLLLSKGIHCANHLSIMRRCFTPLDKEKTPSSYASSDEAITQKGAVTHFKASI